MKWQVWGRRLVYTLIIVGFVVLVWPIGAKPNTVRGHKVDVNYAKMFKHDWNAKYPKVPITKIACLYIPAASVGGKDGKVPAYEDCLVKEVSGTKKPAILCGEVFLRPYYVDNPDNALLGGKTQTCKYVDTMMTKAAQDTGPVA